MPSEGSVSPTTESREEERTTSILVTRADQVVVIDRVIEIDKYSCVRMVLRVTAWLKRFCFNVSKKTKSERKHGPLSLQELTEAEIDWIKAAQRDLKCQENYKQLSNKFGLIEDHKGVITCRGRLEYADLPVEAKEPMYVKGRGKQLKKVYVCLFSCCVTRALHLDQLRRTKERPCARAN